MAGQGRNSEDFGCEGLERRKESVTGKMSVYFHVYHRDRYL